MCEDCEADCLLVHSDVCETKTGQRLRRGPFNKGLRGQRAERPRAERQTDSERQTHQHDSDSQAPPYLHGGRQLEHSGLSIMMVAKAWKVTKA